MKLTSLATAIYSNSIWPVWFSIANVKSIYRIAVILEYFQWLIGDAFCTCLFIFSEWNTTAAADKIERLNFFLSVFELKMLGISKYLNGSFLWIILALETVIAQNVSIGININYSIALIIYRFTYYLNTNYKMFLFFNPVLVLFCYSFWYSLSFRLQIIIQWQFSFSTTWLTTYQLLSNWKDRRYVWFWVTVYYTTVSNDIVYITKTFLKISRL